MVLEATMICIDNSEWMRNGDYHPTRIHAQADAVYLIAGSKTLSNPENKVGILTMAGRGARFLTNTDDVGQVLASIRDVEIGGEVDLKTAIKKAQLALKHRRNKNQQQRIVVFEGSPVKHDKETLELIGKNLKKNNVALDIVNFGEQDGGKTEKLEALLAAVNSNDNSHIVHIPPGPNSLSDVLLSTPIFNGDTETSGVGDFEFGVDPNIDPELVLALRISMEEERARQEEAAKSSAETKMMSLEELLKLLEQSDSRNVSRLNRTALKPAEELDRIKDGLLARLQWGFAGTPEETHGDRELSIDAVKDERSQLDMSEDMDSRPFLPSDINEPPVEDLLASHESQPESEEKKKEDDEPPNDEN